MFIPKKIRSNLFLVAAMALSVSQAYAQSSVTLYGVADSLVTYQNSQTTLGATTGGGSNTRVSSGAWAGSRFGFKGTEDLGGGLAAIFVLESGFSIDTGTAQFTNALFARQSVVGLNDQTYGKVTVGRQYTAYYMQLAAFSPTTWTTGFFGAHAGDVDALDTSVRTNNSIMYTSPTLNNFTVAGSYAFGEVPGSTKQGSTASVGVQYKNGPIGIGAGYMRVNNSTVNGGAWGTDSSTNSGGQPVVSAVTNGYQTAASQQRVAVGAGYFFTPALDISLTGSNVQYTPGSGSSFNHTAIFNTIGSVLHAHVGAPWDLAVGYSETHATSANGIKNAASYKQLTLSQYYALSVRTGLYALQSYQRSSGQTLGTAGSSKIIDATATIGDGFNSSPSASN
ncbi:porin, partial [Glaciimonas sp. GG7]